MNTSCYLAPVQPVDEHGVGLHILDIGIALDPEDSDPYTRAFPTVAATFAELEAAIKRENVREGITAAREHGQWHGRPPFGFDVAAAEEADDATEPTKGWLERTIPTPPRLISAAYGSTVIRR